MKVNKGKFHLVVSNNGHVSIKIDDIEAEISDWEKLLGVKIDPKLIFDDYLSGIFK